MQTATETNKQPSAGLRLVKWLVLAGLVVAIAGTGYVLRDRWLPKAQQLVSSFMSPVGGADEHDDHAGHGAHDDGNSLELSPQARKNINLTTAPVELKPFVRSISVPGLVVGRTGRSKIEVTAPMGGLVTRVYPIQGEALEPGQPLFDLRLTHEELVKAQSDLLRSAEQLDVELREIERLQDLVDSGIVPGTQLLERQYEKQKIEADISAQRQSLLLHGLMEEQVDGIVENRTLVKDMTVVVPPRQERAEQADDTPPFTLRSLHVKPGEYVDAGAALCSLVDYGSLYIEGRAFERDADELLRAAQQDWSVTAILEDNGKKKGTIEDLKIAYVDSEVDPDSRALIFYVELPNEVVHQSESSSGHKFLNWKYKPGQRMQISVPVEQWEKRIVLPIDAVAKDGVEYYVFRQNGKQFDRVPVQVEYQDQYWTVIANDGSLFPRDIVATNGAYQLQVALKNKAGGAVDPHAGHNH